MFYLILPSRDSRDGLIAHLGERGIQAVFHYVPLHSSPAGRRLGRAEGELWVTDDLSARLLRLPFYYELAPGEQEEIAGCVRSFVTKAA